MSDTNVIYLILVAIVVMILLASSLIVFFNFSQKKLLSEKEKNHQQKMNFQKQMLTQTIETQEEERSRIAKELHDDLSSKLNVINLNVELLKLKNDNLKSPEILDLISETLGESIERSRKISHDLMPPILENFGLGEALKDLARKINVSANIAMEVRGYDFLQEVKGQEKFHIFRIVQELCNNTLKHAEASLIELDCQNNQDALVLVYKDNGIGMDASSEKKGVGLMNIESRIQILDASLEQVESDQGVCFKISVPNETQTNTS